MHCIGKVMLKNKFNFTSAVIRSIDLLVGSCHVGVFHVVFQRTSRSGINSSVNLGLSDSRYRDFVCSLLIAQHDSQQQIKI